MATFLVTGTAVVLLQFFGIALNAPAVINWAANDFAPLVYIVAATAGLTAFSMSYLRHWDDSED